MADAADMADAIQAEMIDIAVRKARSVALAGISGECDRCEWWMPRIVDGLCAFCRDGRPRPPDWEPPPRPDPDMIDPPEKAPTMAKSPSAPTRKPIEHPISHEPAPVAPTVRQRMMAALDDVASIAAEVLALPNADAALSRADDAEREVARLSEVLALERERADAAVAKLDSLRAALAA